MQKKLTQKQYLGMGYLHVFRNLETGLEETFPCTEEEYTRMGEVGGYVHKPVREGYEWLRSYGGAIMVDNPNYLLGDDEYTDMGDKLFVCTSDENGIKVGGFMEKNKVVNNFVDVTEAKLAQDLM